MVELIASFIGYNIALIGLLLFNFAVLAKLVKKYGKVWWLYPAIAVFFVVDIIANWNFSLFPFFDKPAVWDETITNRLIRYKKLKPDSFLNKVRVYMAFTLCKRLDRLDPGHCD